MHHSRTVDIDTTAAQLSVRNLSVRFGGIVALDGVSFDVAGGQVFALIGPNGAGKTTVFNCLSGLYPIHGGDIVFEGRSLAGLPAHAMARCGIGRTFQNLALFHRMTVAQNVMVGTHVRTKAGFAAGALRLPGVAAEERLVHERVASLLDELGLAADARRPVGDLPFARQKRVELARALAGEPRLLLLDEPAAGLNHEEREALGTVIRGLRDRRGMTLLLVEHHMGLVMSLSDRIAVLNFGRKIAEGAPQEIRRHPDVVEAYLGAGAHA